MLGSPARITGLLLASAFCAGAALVGCGFQTEGLLPSGPSETVASSSGSGSTPAGGAGGHGAASSSTSAGSGNMGAGGADAGSGEAGPVDAGPTTYASCLDWLTAHPNEPSGVHALVDSSQNVYQAYCEMAGGVGTGGWTLALKIDGNNTGHFAYDDPLWTSFDPLNAVQPDLDTNEAKLASFWSVPLTALRVGMVQNGVTRWLVVPISGGADSLLALINIGGKTTVGVNAWEGLLATGSIQTQCNWEGINADNRVRIGLVGDESVNCMSPDSFIGFGAVPTFAPPSPPSGNIVRSNPGHSDQTAITFGYVMVR